MEQELSAANECRRNCIVQLFFILALCIIFAIHLRGEFRFTSGSVPAFLEHAGAQPYDNLLPYHSNDRCESRVHLRSSSGKISPSSHFISKLRQYEQLHHRCAQEARAFRVQQDLPTFSSSANSSSSCKFLVWISYEGLGNKLLSLVATFIYALLTDRVLLLDRGTDMHQLLCEAFPSSSWFLPESFPSDWLHSLNAPFPNRFGTLIRPAEAKNCRVTPSNISLPDFVYIHMNWDSKDDVDKRFFCQQEQRILTKATWLFMRSNAYYVPGLYLVPSFREELQKWFPDAETTFRNSAKYLLHPSNSVWAATSRYYKSYLAGSSRLIGLQLRLFDNTVALQESYLSEQLLNCLYREQILPNVTRNAGGSQTVHGDGKTSTVLVTSLNELYSERLRDLYLRNPTEDGSLVKVETPSHEGYQQTNALGHDEKALMEIWLLSMSDVLVTSPRSTFGYVAHGLAGLKPWVLRGYQNTHAADMTCSRLLSPDPCFLVPPLSLDCDCTGAKAPTNIISNIKRCVDDPTRAIQLGKL